MKINKTLLAMILSGTSILTFAESSTLTVCATKSPNGEILEYIKPELKKHGVDLKIVYYSSYNDPSILNSSGLRKPSQSLMNPNKEVINGSCDANFFQHQDYLTKYNAIYKSNLVNIGSIFFVPYGIYTTTELAAKYNANKSLKIFNDYTVSISDSSIAELRSLRLMESTGLITLIKQNAQGLDDLVSNPYNLSISKIDTCVTKLITQQLL